MRSVSKADTMLSPQDWPPLYGPPTKSYTLRRFTNNLRHQLTRHTFVAYSRNLRDILRVRRGIWPTTYLELYFALTLSALYHGLVMYAIPHGPNYTFDLRFVMWQAPAIQSEDFVIWGYKRVVVGKTDLGVGDGPQKDTQVRTWHKMVGFVWVLGW